MWRIFLAVPLSFLVVLLLFLVMANLVVRSQEEPSKPPTYFDLDLLVDLDSSLESRERLQPPEPPMEAEAPLSIPSLPEFTAPGSLSSFSTLEPEFLDMQFAVKGMEVSIPAVTVSSSKSVLRVAEALSPPPLLKQEEGMQKGRQAPHPFVRVEATYPKDAVIKGIEGFVEMRFSIDPEGKPQNIKIVKTQPKKMFERAAIEALKQWRYLPFVSSRRDHLPELLTVTIEFKLN